MFRAAIGSIALILLMSCATFQAPLAVRSELAPSGKLRAAINFGNPILATKDAATGDPRGVSVDLSRAVDISYTAAYVVIEGAYLVAQSSPIRSNGEVDREGVRVVVGAGSAYDLFLTRNLKQARIIRAPTSPAVTDRFVAQRLEVAAAVKQQLEAVARRIAGLRLLDGRFMVINQAMGTPRGREIFA